MRAIKETFKGIAALHLLLSVTLFSASCHGQSPKSPDEIFLEEPPVFGIRSEVSPEGSKWLRSLPTDEGEFREKATANEFVAGNIPEFLNHFKSIFVTANGPSGRSHTITFFVTPDYMAVGSNTDFVRMPMAPATAQQVADAYSLVLPTKKMVDLIYDAAPLQLPPKPKPSGNAMRSNQYYLEHNSTIESQRIALQFPLTALISGIKKDVVITNRLNQNPRRVAIYGWHRSSGNPIQPLSLVHDKSYADYSHGIRLVKRSVIVDGLETTLDKVLSDPEIASLLSDEGLILDLRAIR